MLVDCYLRIKRGRAHGGVGRSRVWEFYAQFEKLNLDVSYRNPIKKEDAVDQKAPLGGRNMQTTRRRARPSAPVTPTPSMDTTVAVVGRQLPPDGPGTPQSSLTYCIRCADDDNLLRRLHCNYDKSVNAL